MRRLLRLYPRWWRERHGEEFADLSCMRSHFADAALRRGIWDGVIISGVLAVVVVLTNVVFPVGPNDSDSHPDYMIQRLASGVLMAIVLILIGAHARRRSDATLAGAKGGAAAGMMIGVLVTVTFLVVNNLFFDIISQQHDKRVAFAASGWSSMRAYISVRQLEGAVFVIPIATLIGAVLGLLGAVAYSHAVREASG